MIALSDADLLSAWEAGERATPVERALAVASRAAGESVAGWTVGRRDALLLDLYASAFGGEIELVTACAACEAALELSFAAVDVRSPWGDAEAEHELESPRLTFRLPTSADLLAVIGIDDPVAARLALASRCVRAGKLSEAAISALAARAAELDPQADIELSLSCAACGHAWSTRFDVAGHVWHSLEARSRALLSEVATLAAAFGWSEGEVLHLSAGRRRHYLELAGA